MFARCTSRITGTALLSATAPLTDNWRHGQTFARIPSSQGLEWCCFGHEAAAVGPPSLGLSAHQHDLLASSLHNDLTASNPRSYRVCNRMFKMAIVLTHPPPARGARQSRTRPQLGRLVSSENKDRGKARLGAPGLGRVERRHFQHPVRQTAGAAHTEPAGRAGAPPSRPSMLAEAARS